MKTIQGIGASPGIAIGPAYRFEPEDLHFSTSLVKDRQAEWQRMTHALQTAQSQLQEIYAHAQNELASEQSAIFEAHLQMLQDPDLQTAIQNAILHDGKNAESALTESAEQYALQLEALDDEYFRARAADIRDITRRCLRILLGKPQLKVTLQQASILVATDLTPSDTVSLDKTRLLGFCTAEGGPTSHTAILAKSLGIPAVVGAGAEIFSAREGEILILNANQGQVILQPASEVLSQFKQAQAAAKDRAGQERALAHQPAITQDGKKVEVAANVGNLDDARTAVALGAEGIGLLRTEFLYLERQTEPDEEEQFQAYRAIFEIMGNKPVVIRTLDVGGDKELPYINLGQEENPFLGWRAIRMCLDNPDFFKTQMRAILRAAVGHDIRIMFPMIATVREVKQARALLEEARSELKRAHIPIGEHIQIGIMIEVPSAAIMADQLAKVVDFFSIGTNDLTQYTLAAERTNKRLAHLAHALDPAILRLIAQVIKEGHKAGIWIGMCGEMAGDERAIPLLLGMGLDEFSMAPALIPHAKAVIRTCNTQACMQLAAQALEMADYSEVKALLEAERS
ncbi:MAG: phosphoenolpyruvate--protein phosphotransferase [Anaerolineales bacterium]